MIYDSKVNHFKDSGDWYLEQQPLRVVIISDFEGISGVCTFRQVIEEFGKPFEKAKTLITEDVNAAIRGLKIAGATEIGVVDGHRWGNPPNIIDEKIETGATVLRKKRERDDFIKSCDAQILVGFHAMAGTNDGFLSHTSSSILGLALGLNGQYIGETAWCVWKGAYTGFPTIMVTGDTATVREAKSFFPEITGVTVKTALSRTTAECLPPKKTRRMIEDIAAHALKKLSQFKVPETPKPPIELDLVFASPEFTDPVAAISGYRRKGDRWLSYTVKNWPELDEAFSMALRLVLSHLVNLQENLIEVASEQRNRYVREFVCHVWESKFPPLPKLKTHREKQVQPKQRKL